MNSAPSSAGTIARDVGCERMRPPTRSRPSTSRTRSDAFARLRAAARPAAPAPIIMASASMRYRSAHVLRASPAPFGSARASGSCAIVQALRSLISPSPSFSLHSGPCGYSEHARHSELTCAQIIILVQLGFKYCTRRKNFLLIRLAEACIDRNVSCKWDEKSRSVLVDGRTTTQISYLSDVGVYDRAGSDSVDNGKRWLDKFRVDQPR